MIIIKNLGFACGVNLGIKKALGQGYDWVVILNQDTEIAKNSLSEFIKTLPALNNFIVGPITGSLDKKRWTTILPAIQNDDYVSGALMPIPKNIINKIGLFYEPYFMYYEDVDYCRRSIKYGFKIKNLAVSGLIHNDSSSLGKNSFLHQYYLARNHLLFVQRQAPFGVKLYELVRLPKTLWQHYVHKEKGALIGIKDYFLRRFGPYG